jgi:two-component system NtrC family sensor kinase
VILALLVNAIEAMPNEGRLLIATALDREADSVRLTVRDDGPGIPADVLPRIFEPFFTTKEDQHGTGLGLAVTQSILDQHGGSIAVSSSPGEGTQFVVALPLEAAPAGAGPSPPGMQTRPGEPKGVSR